METDQIPQLTVYNKRDAQLSDFVPSTKNESVQISALNDEDCESLKQTIESKMIGHDDSLSCRSSFNGRKTISQLKNETILRELTFDEDKQLYVCKGFTFDDHPIYGQVQQYMIKR